jgi:glycosyltransferase involved in cell wall biosynthesis
MTPPRILLSAGMIQRGRSGVGRYVIEISRHIAVDPSVELVIAGLDEDRSLFPWIGDAHWVSIPAAAAKGPANLAWHQLKLPGVLRRERIDVLHIPSYRRIIARSPVPQLATIHDCAPFHLRDKYGALRGFFGRVIVPRLARRCAHILTVSHATGRDLVQFMQLPEEQITVIWNGIDEDHYQPPSAEAMDAFRETKHLNAPVFLYIARLEHPGKNHVRLIEAFEKVEGEPLLVLGGADWHGAEVIHQRVKDSIARERILMPGFMEEAEMPLWYGTAHAMVFPSLFEGFGLPVAEAMACGTRVIASDRGSIPEVGGEAAEYIDPTSVDDLARSMQAVLSESVEQRERRIKDGHAQAAKFSWRLAAEQTCAAARRLLNPSS